ncbi:acyl-CoA dehydrogenase family protein [Streptomyces iranensis]|uniref:Acyl-CoA dehydrogenase domain-containingprotein n=1 Tax=Streptomyces iranensis TaxID=576784 RepID=A0A061ABZ3_9ACTN|nr:acyl-CoA dehydrogenase family protein [Streptomyces iranensis]MBP2067722.1 alkylation response protein AidB-like acyl-CoA dehydrogenase [Streptomyces iranensis]CDR17966.1 acyl-CoA dehydrogenase domain-containingprotein [Streptomyces iranensis]
MPSATAQDTGTPSARRAHWSVRLAEFLDAHAGRPPRDKTERLAWARAFHAELQETGLAAPGWPTEAGGMGLDLADQIAYHQQMTAVRAPKHPCGLSFIVAPTLIKHGTAEQKKRFLRPLLRADEFWCQGFSEPDAGSDLTSLTTRAERAGDEYIVNGQKLWTTMAHLADWMFALIRTGPAGPGGAGISYLLIPMKSRGITVRPLKDISGGTHFSEVYFDDVRVPVENLVGEEHGGWAIARTSLGHERATAFLSDEFRFRRVVNELHRLAKTSGAANDPLVRQDLARIEASVRVLASNSRRALDAVLQGRDPGPAASVNRLVRAEFDQRLHEVALRVLGPDAVLGQREPTAPEGGRWTYGYLMSRSSTIGAGTAEIQRNTIAERVLGLPSGRKQA